MKNGGRIPWNVTAIFETYKINYERRFGVPFEAPVIPFGAMVEYHPISAEDLSRLHQFAQKYRQVFSLGMRYGEESGKETSWSRTLSNGKRWTHLQSMLTDSMQKQC